MPKIPREVTTRYLLIGSVCLGCGSTFFPKRGLCPLCGRKGKLAPKSLAKEGNVVSASILRGRRQRVIGVVEVDGCKIPTTLTDVDMDSDVMKLIGMEVVPTFRRIREDEVIEYGLVFRPKDPLDDREPARPKKTEVSGKAGLVGYGVYIPRFRIRIEKICKVFGKDPKLYIRGLGIEEKSVGNFNEDSITFAVEAAKRALRRTGVEADGIGFIGLGTESPPYAVKSAITTIAMAIGAGHNVRGRTSEFACKAATDQIPDAINAVDSGETDYALVIGSDKAQGEPGDDLYFSVGEGACALLFGKTNVIARVEGFKTYISDTPDFWRKEGEHPKHGGRFTGLPGYFRHVISAAKMLMEDLGLGPSDFDYAVFHQPNSKFPLKAAKMLGFGLDKIKQGLKVRWIGNTYAASTLIGLASILDVAEDNQRILAVSYGSGAGSDAMSIMTEEGINEARGLTVDDIVMNKVYVDHDFYALSKGVLR